MALNVLGILDAVVSHAMASGHFERVNQHEPENPPGHGLTAAVWANRVTPVRSSGLSSLSVLLTFNVRLFAPMIQNPPDEIDPNMLAAVDTLCAAYSGDFTLGGLLRSVDLLGAHGQPLDVLAGYIQQDGAKYRVMTISLPVVVNDLWTEVA
ncbi:hypothetical protein GCM10010400_40000 [Streptomyces aculeolatus]|uniref:hypothetical protein n=1 Tax=Streptomyces aculeolatus TaxID=270689 RepID=UPI001CEC916C|nr:hypothetical protein [Streptomyces aculeolatus]